ncbi:MAG: hypothetical protein COU11_01485 [Candidatus Harrisonbacteria bacterium CG10_big_fil_rev_8_21_14_0_10_49_15]|uniref:Dockerin domain-containing protein n=1 Tax=Candidatus Harrisonbacteria bacterium CG10_big_fil_rev_8_21_14_0_10_49_15 TaxID=1974587 RepID=A0A2H0ULD3_9BACT|nr:MAG: hypothetical protein COU11_01485 [Candidatus Harrisonbacteria bacterium CG10_big_fil_rev_8_21_14_0_10_49_15]
MRLILAAMILASSFSILTSGIAPAHAQTASSTNFTVENPTIGQLGGYATSSNFQLWGSIPFISPGTGSTTNFILKPGFLNFPAESAATSTPTSTPSTPSGGGGSVPGRAIPAAICAKVDFNKTGWVDFVDFSILLFYFDKSGETIRPYDLNNDEKINIVDISIFMFYWDGHVVKCPTI